jgi:hypothetical protein
VSYHNHSVTSELSAPFQSFAHKGRADPLALMSRGDSQWAKPHDVQMRMFGQGYWRKQNMPHDRAFDLCDQRNQPHRFPSQDFNEVRLRGSFERALVRRTDGGAIGFGLGTNAHTPTSTTISIDVAVDANLFSLVCRQDHLRHRTSAQDVADVPKDYILLNRRRFYPNVSVGSAMPDHTRHLPVEDFGFQRRY